MVFLCFRDSFSVLNRYKCDWVKILWYFIQLFSCFHQLWQCNGLCSVWICGIQRNSSWKMFCNYSMGFLPSMFVHSFVFESALLTEFDLRVQKGWMLREKKKLKDIPVNWFSIVRSKVCRRLSQWGKSKSWEIIAICTQRYVLIHNMQQIGLVEASMVRCMWFPCTWFENFTSISIHLPFLSVLFFWKKKESKHVTLIEPLGKNPERSCLP